MYATRMITAAAAAVAVLVGFAPFLGEPIEAGSLSQFSTDQPPTFWFGRATILLLVIGAAAAFRSLRIAAGLAVVAVGTAVAPLIAPTLRGTDAYGWTAYSSSPPPLLPTIDATPRWGLGALMLLATFTAAVLMLALIRERQGPGGMRTIVVGLVTLVAISAEVVVAVSYRNSSMGSPRRYVDYLPVSTGSNLGTSSAWYAVGIVVLVLVAMIVASARRPVSDTPQRRSS
jgi:heme/copper-type cytochrome/quinol oxidase subunit 1